MFELFISILFPTVLFYISLNILRVLAVNSFKDKKEISKYRQVCAKYDYENQSEELGEESPGTITSKDTEKTENGMVKHLTTLYDDCKTMYDVLQCGSKRSIRYELHDAGESLDDQTQLTHASHDVML